MPVGEPVLELTGITKRFPGVVANDNINLNVRAAEVHAIVGENGAGKSTLMSVLYGLYPPDEGTIRIQGRDRRFRNPLDAMDAGLGMVFQNFKLFRSLTVADNVVYRDEPIKWRFATDRKEADRRVAELGERFGLVVDPRARVEDLSVGEQQRVEILKALYRDARILILDEPTAVLTPQETEALFQVMRRLKEDDRTILFITHKLREVMEVADRATVLRHGRVATARQVSETNPGQLSADMTGRPVDLDARPPECEPGDVVLSVDGVTITDGNGVDKVADVSFTVGESEILGIAAIAGNGQEELLRAVAGLIVTSSGTVSVLGSRVESMSVEERRARFLAYVPEDRHGVGSAGAASVRDNLLMGYHRLERFQKQGWLDRAAIGDHARRLIEQYDIVVSADDVPVSFLSGGNLQKVVIAREFGHEAPLLIAEQPTRGVDIGAIEFIHQQVVDYRDRGGAVLLVSAELSELMTLSTRILVMYEGRVMAELDPLDTTEAEIGLHMTGAGKSYDCAEAQDG